MNTNLVPRREPAESAPEITIGAQPQLSAFIRRRRPLNLSLIWKPLFSAEPGYSSAAWVVSAAHQLAARSTRVFPDRWLDKLKAAFPPVSDSQRVPDKAFEEVPRNVWVEPSLLGEMLSAARRFFDTPERSGYAGRISVGEVYTPALIAREIVSEVHVGARRVLDPACGAGIFLLEAFERAYRRRLEGGAAPAQAAEAALSHEIAGVDVDGEALAVAEFSLRLLALRHAGLDHDVPVDLRKADALEPLAGLDGSCDCIVGNPPFIEGRGLSKATLDSLRGRFRVAAVGKVNLFAVFVERALELLKDNGVMAFVLPATFQRNARYLALRELLLEHTLEAIKPLDRTLFSQAVETVVLRVRKKPPQKSSLVQLIDGPTLQSKLPMGPVLRFCDRLSRELRRQIDCMERQGVPLSSFFEVRDGISTGFQPFPLRLLGTVKGGQFIAANGVKMPFDPAIHHKVIDGSEFNIYTPIQWAGRYIEWDKAHEHTPPHPGRHFNCQLRDREIYDRPEKLLTRQTAKGLIATIDRERYFVRNSVHVTYPKAAAEGLSLDALCACLNSRFYTDYFLGVTGEHGVVFPQVHIADIKQLPLVPGLLGPGGKLAVLGRELLELHRAEKPDAAAVASRKEMIEQLLMHAFAVI